MQPLPAVQSELNPADDQRFVLELSKKGAGSAGAGFKAKEDHLRKIRGFFGNHAQMQLRSSLMRKLGEPMLLLDDLAQVSKS